jgi:hypothetical protein
MLFIAFPCFCLLFNDSLKSKQTQAKTSKIIEISMKINEISMKISEISMKIYENL